MDHISPFVVFVGFDEEDLLFDIIFEDPCLGASYGKFLLINWSLYIWGREGNSGRIIWSSGNRYLKINDDEIQKYIRIGNNILKS